MSQTKICSFNSRQFELEEPNGRQRAVFGHGSALGRFIFLRSRLSLHGRVNSMEMP